MNPHSLLTRAALLATLASTGFIFEAARAQETPEAAPAPPAAESEDAKLLEQLTHLEDTVNKARSGNNISVASAIREAAANEAKAIDLWLESIRDSEFRAKEKKDAEWRQWRDGAAKRLHAPGAGTALRLHFQYLLLTIKAASAKTDADRAELMGNLVSYLDDLARGGKDMLANRQPLDQSVISTAVARRYKLDSTAQVEGAWTYNPGDIGGIYNTVILPYYRLKHDPARLQTVWNKRIQQEAALAAAADSEFQRKYFREVTQPGLEWAMARDMFAAGNRQAANKMMLIIQQNQAHSEAPTWLKELRTLLTQPAVAGAATSPQEPVASTATPPENEETPPVADPPANAEPQGDREAGPSGTPPPRRAPPAAFPPNLGPGR